MGKITVCVPFLSGIKLQQSQSYWAILTLCLPVSSADNLGKKFGPRSGPTILRTCSGSKLFDILMVFLKEFFKRLILKKSADDNEA